MPFAIDLLPSAVPRGAVRETSDGLRQLARKCEVADARPPPHAHAELTTIGTALAPLVTPAAAIEIFALDEHVEASRLDARIDHLCATDEAAARALDRFGRTQPAHCDAVRPWLRAAAETPVLSLNQECLAAALLLVDAHAVEQPERKPPPKRAAAPAPARAPTRAYVPTPAEAPRFVEPPAAPREVTSKRVDGVLANTPPVTLVDLQRRQTVTGTEPSCDVLVGTLDAEYQRASQKGCVARGNAATCESNLCEQTRRQLRALPPAALNCADARDQHVRLHPSRAAEIRAKAGCKA